MDFMNRSVGNNTFYQDKTICETPNFVNSMHLFIQMQKNLAKKLSSFKNNEKIFYY